MSATRSRNTIIDKRLVITNVILSPESGGTLKAKILRPDQKNTFCKKLISEAVLQ